MSVASITGRALIGVGLGPVPGDFAAVIPEISGTAYIAGFCNWVLDARDPLKNGFLVR